jgi:CheY-like chemotaxis protein
MAKVLLVEDDDTMLSLLKTLLMMEGFQVAVLDHEQKDVLSSIRKEMPDLLLLDVHLPHHSGLELLRAIRESNDLKDILVVMTSGMALQTECLAAGANDFLLKPYMPDDLIGILNRSLTINP